MSFPNTLIFVDFPSSEPSASGEFYEAVFGWVVEPRPAEVFHRIVPGQNFQLDDGTQGPTGNLHMGIYNVANARPHPDPAGVAPRDLTPASRSPRVWILVSEDDSIDRIIDEAVSRGATLLWRDHFWAEFNGFNAAFEDPWGNTFVLWVKAGESPQIPDGWTDE